MFWDAVQATFVALTHWQVYAAGLEYVIIVFAPLLIAYMLGIRYGSDDPVKHTSVILVPLFQALGTVFFVYSVAQIALGQAHYSTWRIPFEVAFGSPGKFIILVVLIVAASFLLAIVPIAGQIYALQTLVLSGLALGVLFVMADGQDFPQYTEIDWLPSFWFICGIIVVGAIFGTIGVALISTLPQILSNLTGRDMTAIGVLISIPIASTFGFVPFFIYAAWIGLQITPAG
ncbi:MAG: hypothetical protein ABJI96_20490 [Paracoccaceae bacterium]